ncbi:MXAN_6230/SCO0854 family RING domain-containing protein [Streptomyces olivoreticuli]|uniref:MXAN_6230/SCO0854 family RING domain-containing protein n=1 Tax=Streptomyces olivoreticuli TaxID=68246 RepID=UPI000E21DD69|nr:MXAN_6230/SCO0854 family RING domain-containing protein [Streptomyces olivoreticuli]
MTTTTISTGTAGGRRGLAAALLARRGAVYLPTASRTQPAPEALAGVTLLETDLLERGYVMAGDLRQALTTLDTGTLAAAGTALLADIDRALGADRDHTPLFRDFPHSVPTDTLAFYVDRVLTVLCQAPEQPCVLCGTEGTVHAVSPCAHLVCGACYDGGDFSACPICHRRVDTGDPFLRPERTRDFARADRSLPNRLRVLTHGGDPTARAADAGHELETLLRRAGALSPQDADDLEAFLAVRDRTDVSWLPQTVPGRETKARVLAWLLADPAAYEVTLPAATALVDTATDVLRLLAVLSGGDAGLVDVPRLAAVPRPLRRALLAALDRLDPALVAEDMRRHPRLWKHAAERLHPFEYARRYPNAALAVAALRDLRLSDDSLSARIRATAEDLPSADASGARVRVRDWPGRVEAALAAADAEAAVALLARRPGELLRRLDHLLRLAGKDSTDKDSKDSTETVLSALATAVPRVSPAVLLSTLGEIRTRSRKGRDRVFFPKGGNAKAHIAPDERVLLTDDVVERVVAVLTGEVLRRAGTLEKTELAVIDAALDGVVAPFTERTASRSLVTLPRGSELPVPAGRTVRLFLHWTESETSGRADLDLSLAMFDAEWEHVGTCDYTNLRHGHDAAVHSGDLTSAPAPQGASEFVDLDLDRLGATGVRYLVAVVFSFNSVAFDDLAEAFSGLMVRDEPGGTGPVFDPRQVEQRFDLTGRAHACVPMVVDVADRTMRWLDVVKGVTGTHHAVHRHSDDLAALGRGLTDLFTSGARVGLGELATWRSAARAGTVVVRHLDGSTSTYRRAADEGVAEFAARIGTPATDEDGAPDLSRARLAHLLRGDLALPPGSEVYALHPAGLNAASVRLLTASDLVTALESLP